MENFRSDNVEQMILLKCGMNGVQMEILDNNCILCLVPLFAGLYWSCVGQVAALSASPEMEIFHPMP